MSNPPLGAPIVQVHGIFGFGQLKLAGVGVADYFRLIPGALRAEGHVVPEPPCLNMAGSIAERAADLKKYLDNHPEVAGRQVHLVAHSMGGLDARFMISKLDMANRIMSLTTIGTPHRGSPIADLVGAAAPPGFSLVVERAGIDIKGIADLTTTACERFNLEVLDSPKVRYFSIAGSFEPPRVLGVPVGVLSLTHDIVRNKEGDNDGAVSVESARFGQRQENWTFLGTWPVNHFRQINWGTDILLTPAEEKDNAVVEEYKVLAVRLRNLPPL
jgi:triacylglycerol lipase